MPFVGKTHTGNVRKANQDRFLIKEDNAGFTLLAVADGLGGYGHSGSEIAAQLVIDALNNFKPTSPDIEKQLAALLVETSEKILIDAENDPNLEGMGTTITAVLIQDATAYWAHVGDTRCYLYRDGGLILLTVDQNMAQFLVEEGEITPAEAMTSPARNMLDQCVGFPDCKPATGLFEARKADLLLLSSDGLHDEVPHEILAMHLSRKTTNAARVNSLVEAALEAGGRDNITVFAGDIR